MKTVFRAALLLALLSAPAYAASTVDKSGALTAGATAQNAIASNTGRKAWCIQNPSTAATQNIATAENLYVRIDGTASATTGVELVPGAMACNAPGQMDTTAISVYATTIAHKWKAFEVSDGQ